MKRARKNTFAVFFDIFGSFLLAIFFFSSPVFSSSSVFPNDQQVSEQSYLRQINIEDAWSRTTGTAKILTAIIDSGIDADHPDLQESVWTNPDEIPGDGVDNDKNGYVDDINGWDFINDIPDPNPKFGGEFTVEGIQHGTLLAGIIAARGNNWIGISGISWRSRILPLRVLDNKANGNVYDVVRAIDYAIDKRADIINLSFMSDKDSSFLRTAIQRAVRAGITVVVAAGNDDTAANGFDLAEKPVYPACTYFSEPGVIVVGATDSLGQKARFSPYGPCIDVMAPGSDIFSTQVVQYERVGFDVFYGGGWSGTSLSTAMVSGTIALMKAVNPGLTPAEIDNFIKTYCDPIDILNPSYAGKLGCGQLNSGKLIQAAIDRAQNPNPFEESRSARRNAIALARADSGLSVYFFDEKGDIIKWRKPFAPYDPFHVRYTMSASSKSGRMIFAASAGAGPHIRVFDREGKLVSNFFAYDRQWRIGVVAALGDVDGDGQEEIVTAPAFRGGAHIKIFTLEGELKKHFFAYPKNYRGDYILALGDLNNDSKKEIIISSSGSKNGGLIKAFSGSGTLLTQFIAYPKSNITELSFAVGDVDSDGDEEIVVAPASGRAPLTIFSNIGAFERSLFPYGATYDRGISLATGDLNGDGSDEIITVPKTRAPAQVMIFNGAGKKVGTFFATKKNDRKGYIVQVLQ